MAEESQQWPQFLAAVTSSLLAVGCGLHFGWPSPAIPKLLNKELFELTEEEVSYIVMVGPLGYLVSSPFSAFVVDRIGRKLALLLLAVPQILAWILVANSRGFATLYASRLLAGAAEGALFNILPMYLGEISEPQIRGAVGTIFSVALTSGILLINCYGSFISLKTSAYVSISVPLLAVVTFVWMPESPYFFLMHGRTEDARASLKKLRKMNDVERELAALTLDVQRQISEPGTFKEVFTDGANLRAFVILMGLRTLQQFSGYSAFSFYNQVIFEHVGGQVEKYSIVYNASHVVFVSFGSVLLDRCGRRSLLIWPTAGISVVLFFEGLYFYFRHYAYDTSWFWWVPITGLILYTVMFDVGLGVVPNVLTGEIFAANVKAKALGILIIYCALTVSASSKLFQWLDLYFGMHVPFYVFSFCSAMGTLFCALYVPETKGKSLEEIQQILKNK